MTSDIQTRLSSLKMNFHKPSTKATATKLLVLLQIVALSVLAASQSTSPESAPLVIQHQQDHHAVKHHHSQHHSHHQDLQKEPPGECGAHKLCENGGTCVEGHNNFTCVCPEGFTGSYCQRDVNECAQRPSVCKNGATCLNKPGGYQCSCVNGWTGSDCSENVDDCLNAACMSGATCHDRVGNFYCECPPGKTGLLCQLDDGCYNNPCHPNATCDTSPIDGHFMCTCPHGFIGTDCSIDVDECMAGSPCEHGGVCVNTPGSFKCECPRGFTGTRCEININECDSNPCLNEGTCLDEKGGYKCICTSGYTGSRCEININECDKNPCQNGAICQDLVNSFRCICPKDYHGQFCEFPSNHQPTSHNQGMTIPIGKNNPWFNCTDSITCWIAFRNGKCDENCNTPGCLYDGGDCFTPASNDNILSPFSNTSTIIKPNCDEKADSYCLKNYGNGRCDRECNYAECAWDGGDCDTNNDESSPNTAEGYLFLRVTPSINLGDSSGVHQNIELARLLRKVAVASKTILKIQSFRQVEDGTEIQLLADNRNCRSSCYNNTELIARFLSALRARTKEFDLDPNNPLGLSLSEARSDRDRDKDFRPSPTINAWFTYSMVCIAGVVVSVVTVFMISSNQKKVKQKAVVWFPEGFKPVVSSRNRDPTNKKGNRGVSTLQALGGNFFRGFKRNERNISSNPNGFNSTDVDRCNTATPNGGGIYHEPYDQYDQYGTYNGTDSGSIMNPVDEPMTPTPMPLNPINLEGPHGLTPLMVASMGTPFGTKEPPLGLVAYGTTGEMNGPTDNNVTDLLHRGAQLNMANKDTGETALHFAARYGRVDNARSILERCDSQDVNAQDATGRTPLHAAIAADSLGVFELLIRCRGTDLNAQTHDGTTPLILATRVGTYSMLEELIQNECEVTKSDANGKTALHWAAATNNVDAIRRLLEVRETNKDAQDLAEETPLFLAAREGAKGAVEILLSHNANKDISDQMDRSPIEIARSRNHYDIVRLLEEYEPPTPRSINSMQHSSRQMSPFSPLTDSNNNSNSSTALPPPPPPPSYHNHSQSGGRVVGRAAQKATLARSSSTKPLISEANIIRNNLQSHCKSVMVIKAEDKDGTVQNYNNNNNNYALDKTHGQTEGYRHIYNVPCLKNYMTPSPDSPFSVDSSMTSPFGAYNDQQYQNSIHPSLANQKQAGVFI